MFEQPDAAGAMDVRQFQLHVYLSGTAEADQFGSDGGFVQVIPLVVDKFPFGFDVSQGGHHGRVAGMGFLHDQIDLFAAGATKGQGFVVDGT